MMALAQSTSDLELLVQNHAYNPHRLLGVHETPFGSVIRIWRPGAQAIQIELKGKIIPAERIDERGLFEVRSMEKLGAVDYRIYHQSGLLAHDPYAFLPTIGEIDTFLFNKGCHYQVHEMLGANYREFHGVKGVRFAVWAPNAQAVSLVADFNHWDGRLYPMRSLGVSGIWELFIPGLHPGEKYKFEIRTQAGELLIKSDPVAFFSEMRPKNASVVFDVRQYAWQDAAWMEKRRQKTIDGPLNIYEVHLGSWKKRNEGFPNYRQLAEELGQYCQERGYTHVELLPILEHPLDESWGYQVSGFYSVTSRYGTPADFQFFVDSLHQKGIGVILDWVPAHFPKDAFALMRFDGTALYEHEDPRKGSHPHWNTAIFNYGRKEVVNFLIGSALYWLDQMHIDGLRVDAVASMLYLDYGRNEGEWEPNADGSNFNQEAIEFLKHLNSIVHQRFPGVWMIAEESSSFQGVTHPVEQNGLGFDLKWNMGWMNDTLRYFLKDPIYRKFHQNDLTFSLIYAFSERFLSVLSHDEVVHMKGSLLSKMPGPDWQKFANLRLLYSYLMCHPGKKLLFMGGEIGQWTEWNCQGQLDWYLLQYPLHQGIFDLVKDLNHFYLAQPALWEYDFDWRGYEWIDFSDSEQSVICYLRKGKTKTLVCVHHFTPEYRPGYWVPLSHVKRVKEVFNTDAPLYGGSGKCNQPIPLSKNEQGIPAGFTIALAPLATQIFEVEFV